MTEAWELARSCVCTAGAFLVIVVILMNAIRQPGAYFPWEEDDDEGFEE